MALISRTFAKKLLAINLNILDKRKKGVLYSTPIQNNHYLRIKNLFIKFMAVVAEQPCQASVKPRSIV